MSQYQIQKRLEKNNLFMWHFHHKHHYYSFGYHTPQYYHDYSGLIHNCFCPTTTDGFILTVLVGVFSHAE